MIRFFNLFLPRHVPFHIGPLLLSPSNLVFIHPYIYTLHIKGEYNVSKVVPEARRGPRVAHFLAL